MGNLLFDVFVSGQVGPVYRRLTSNSRRERGLDAWRKAEKR